MKTDNNGKQQCSSSQRWPFKIDGVARRGKGWLLLPYTLQLLACIGRERH